MPLRKAEHGQLVESGQPDPVVAEEARASTRAALDASRWDRIEEADKASNSRRWREAAELWDALRVDFPDEPLFWSKAGEAYCEALLLDRADEILREGGRLFPDDMWLAHQYAIVAQRQEDWAEALLRAEEFRRRFASQSLGFLLQGEALFRLGRVAEAEAVFAAAVRCYPGDEWVLYGFAQIATQRGDWREALVRWEAMLAQFPEHAAAAIRRGEALRELGRLDEAEAALAETIERFPENEMGYANYALVAARRGDWSEALSRWESLPTRSGSLVLALIGIAEALTELGRPDEADSVITEALAADPANPRALAIRSLLELKLRPHETVVRKIREAGFEPVLSQRIGDPEVLIEITSICNFACTYCVSPMKLREKKHMSLDLFQSVIRQVATITTKPVRLHVDGEPTVHPNFKEMALLVNQHGLPVWLATNGSRLDRDFLEIWMGLLISMSTSPEELAKRHNKLDHVGYIKRIAAYVRAWSQSAARQEIELQILYYPQQDEMAQARYRDQKNTFMIEFCDEAGLYEFCTAESTIDDDSYCFSRRAHPGKLSFVKWPVSGGGLYPVDGNLLPRERATAGFCDAPWRQLAIHSDGSLGACCVDLSGGTTFAGPDQAQAQSIKELWESGAQITQMRRRFLEGHIEREVCQRCLAQAQVSFAAASS